MNRNEILKCAICGMTVEVLTAGSDRAPICCGQPMTAMAEQTAEYKFEKHVPYPEALPGVGFRVVVGKEAAHPMTEAHYIEWIEVQDGDNVIRKYLAPGEAPRADFAMPLRPGLVIREFCNLHGLWKYVVE